MNTFQYINSILTIIGIFYTVMLMKRNTDDRKYLVAPIIFFLTNFIFHVFLFIYLNTSLLPDIIDTVYINNLSSILRMQDILMVLGILILLRNGIRKIE